MDPDVSAPSIGQRIRTSNDILAMMIEDATTHSITFRRLTESIQATNGIVYVELGRCAGSVRSCLPFWMKAAGPNRVLRVIVERLEPRIETIGDIAHELQHALEVLGERNIATGTGMFFFYKSYGSRQGDMFETEKAVLVGHAVLREMKRRPRAAMTHPPSVRPLTFARTALRATSTRATSD